MFDKTKLYLHVPGYNRVAGYTLFIPLEKNEKIIEELKAIDGVQLKKNFNESLCQNCGIEFRYFNHGEPCLLYTSPSPRDSCASRMPSSA